MVEYDEYGRPVEKAAKPKKLEWDDPDYPFTFAVSIVNRQTGDGVKDFETTEKIKTAKGAAKRAWKDVQRSRGALSEFVPAGEWLIAQEWADLVLVVRPVTAQRDVVQGGSTGKMFSARWRGTQELTVAWAYEHVAQHPMEAQEFYDSSGTWVSAKTTGVWPDFHGASTIIPLLDIVE